MHWKLMTVQFRQGCLIRHRTGVQLCSSCHMHYITALATYFALTSDVHACSTTYHI